MKVLHGHAFKRSLIKVFTGKGARYLDNVVAWPSVEPADDYTALTMLVFAREVG